MATAETTSGGTTRSRDGTRIAFERRGAGPALVLVDGATQYRALDPSSAQLAELLSTRFTVVRYDRRGRGESSDTLPYAVARELEDLDAVIAATSGGEAAFVLGSSSGGVLALEAAAQGSRIGRLAVYEPPFVVDDGRPPLPADYVRRLDEHVANRRPGDAVELFMTAAAGLPAEMVTGMRELPMWPALEAVAHTIAYDGRIMGDTMSGDPATLARFASVAAPTLVLDGGDSPGWQHRAVDALAQVLPSAERRTLAGQAHGADPAVLAPVLASFFSAKSR